LFQKRGNDSIVLSHQGQSKMLLVKARMTHGARNVMAFGQSLTGFGREFF
jgi:hypothetical protein